MGFKDRFKDYIATVKNDSASYQTLHDVWEYPYNIQDRQLGQICIDCLPPEMRNFYYLKSVYRKGELFFDTFYNGNMDTPHHQDGKAKINGCEVRLRMKDRAVEIYPQMNLYPEIIIIQVKNLVVSASCARDGVWLNWQEYAKKAFVAISDELYKKYPTKYGNLLKICNPKIYSKLSSKYGDLKYVQNLRNQKQEITIKTNPEKLVTKSIESSSIEQDAQTFNPEFEAE